MSSRGRSAVRPCPLRPGSSDREDPAIAAQVAHRVPKSALRKRRSELESN